MTRVHTIGYEGASLEDFIATLILAGIGHVADVREIAQSRRPGFSKNKLSDALADKGIAYTHLRELGDPKPGRDAARRGDIAQFKAIYQSHLERPEAQIALNDLVDTAKSSPTVLLCYERNPQDCHRSIIARSLHADYSLEVNHLGVMSGAASQCRPIATAA